MSKRTVYTTEQLTQIKELYLSGLSAVQVASRMNTDKGTCRREITTMGILRSISETRRITMGIKFVKSDAFDLLTPEALYWVGFLYADGSIEKNVPTVGVALAEVDKTHLEKFNQFLGGQLHITECTPKKQDMTLKGRIDYSGRMFRVKVADRKLYDRLKELGFTSNKTHVIVPHELLKHSRDFWRGCVDGDGWISLSNSQGANHGIEGAKVYTYPKIGLCGNKATITEFLKFIEMNGIVCKSGVKKAPRENSLYSMDSTSKPAVAIMNLLYKDSVTYLDRKYEKYLECIKLNS